MMSYLNKIIPVICLLILSACGSQKSSDYDIQGLWSLYIMEVKDAESGEWKEWKNGMGGYLLYGEGYGALHLFERGYQDTDLRFPNFNDGIPIEALKHLTKSYYYIADYQIDHKNQIVTHTRISHSNPGDWGETVQRRFHFNGDTLVLQPVEKENASLRLKWIRQNN